MARKPIGKRAMTSTERAQRRRARLKKEALRAEKQEKNRVKGERRAQREAALAEATVKASRALGSKLYGVIYADPPWQFEVYSRETGMDRAADNHYPTMPVDEIKAIRPPAANDCVLFLWATAPMLLEAIDVMQTWGFAYKTHYVWDKEFRGTGYWARGEHELLLIGTRGEVPAPALGDRLGSMIRFRATRHSEKPAAAAEMIERYFPTTPKLEMFARGPARPGWEPWGNESELANTA
jgi:N6-adenosine-specific RNA methylase IME4